MKRLFETGKQIVGAIMSKGTQIAETVTQERSSLANTGQSCTTQVKVTDEDKRELAYHLWEEAGCPHGRSDEFWFKAEAALSDQPCHTPSDE